MDNYLVGITMGPAIRNVVCSEYFIRSPIKATFVPLVGGIAESFLDIHSNYLAQEFADRFVGNCIQFFAPAFFFAEGGTRGIPRGKDNPQCCPSVFATRPHPYGHRDSLDGARDADIDCAENLIRL